MEGQLSGRRVSLPVLWSGCLLFEAFDLPQWFHDFCFS